MTTIAHRLKGVLAGLSAGFLAVCLPALADAQNKFPSRPVTLIVPSPPGGGTDIFARLLAELVEPKLGQKMIVENRPGGGGTLGVTVLSNARPDGLTLGMIWNSPLTAAPASLEVAYTADSYTPILRVGAGPYTLCAAPDFPAADAKGLIEHLRANPGKYTYGNDGVGGTMQLGAERLFRKLDLKVRAVPFGGAGETARNFLGGHVTFYGGSLPPILPHVAAGKAKCLLLTSSADNAALPTAAGLQSLGLAAEETMLWWGVIGPKGLSAEHVAFYDALFREAAQSPRFTEALKAQGAEPALLGSAEMGKLIRDELAALGDVAKAVGVTRKSAQ